MWSYVLRTNGPIRALPDAKFLAFYEPWAPMAHEPNVFPSNFDPVSVHKYVTLVTTLAFETIFLFLGSSMYCPVLICGEYGVCMSRETGEEEEITLLVDEAGAMHAWTFQLTTNTNHHLDRRAKYNNYIHWPCAYVQI
jgi:hypothetical protein